MPVNIIVVTLGEAELNTVKRKGNMSNEVIITNISSHKLLVALDIGIKTIET